MPFRKSEIFQITIGIGGYGCAQPRIRILPALYLHYAFNLWVKVWRTKCAQGDVIVVRYADDILLGFQHRAEADRFLELFRERLGKFGLELHPDKTRRIEFGRYAERDREQKGEKENLRRSTFWVLRTSAERTGKGRSP
jgi:hypothetical protein